MYFLFEKYDAEKRPQFVIAENVDEAERAPLEKIEFRGMLSE